MAMMGRDDYAVTYGLMKSRKQKTQGVIYIEDITDKPFWEKIAFNHVVKLYSENNQAITGKSKLLQICSANQLIAIDSDFDDLCPQHRPESILFSNKKDFILKTYAHGRENIVFSPECLKQILDKKFQLYLDNHDNPIFNIFEQLSAIWFKPYQKFLYLFNQKQYEHDDWISKIQFHNQECQDIALKNDFSAYASRLSEFDAELNRQISNQDEFQTFCDELTNKSFSKENVWAFIRCHDFEEKFVMKIMEMICGQRIKTEMNFIQSSYIGDEIKARKEQCNNHFQKTNGIQTVLNHYFYDVYFDYAKDKNIFIKKMITDYNRLIQ